MAVRPIQMEKIADIITLQGDTREANIHFGNLVVSENDLANATRYVVQLLRPGYFVLFQGDTRQTDVHVAEVLISEDDSRYSARCIV